jgi:RNA polymerase sigma-70 factor, ECF subfamily
MLGNFEDAEDLVQETFARAWRNRAGFEGRSTLRAWLYRIATNACLDDIKRKKRRVQTGPTPPSADHPPSFDEVPWLQPIPDQFLGGTANPAIEPDAVVIAQETVELAFLATVQHLAPRPRAVLILRDVLGWSASETAEALDGTVPRSTVPSSEPGPACKSSDNPVGWSGLRCSRRPMMSGSSCSDTWTPTPVPTPPP